MERTMNEEQRRIGLELNDTYNLIRGTRFMIAELRHQDPVPHDQIEAQREDLAEARLARSGLERQLAMVKLDKLVPPEVWQ